MIDLTGGLKGVRDVGLLYSIAERPKMAMMGREFYPDIFAKAAAYLEALVAYYVFMDGNKRTAFLSAGTFLGLNGHDVNASNDAAYRLVMSVALNKKTIEEIATWLKKHSRKISA